MANVLEEQRGSRILDNFRSGSFAHSLRAYDPYDRYIPFLVSESGDAAKIAEPFRISEVARARGFLEMLASVRSTVASSLPPSVLEEENEIIRRISGVQSRLREIELTSQDRETLTAQLADREQKRENFRLKLRV